MIPSLYGFMEWNVNKMDTITLGNGETPYR
jgi:hypothetical protein